MATPLITFKTTFKNAAGQTRIIREGVRFAAHLTTVEEEAAWCRHNAEKRVDPEWEWQETIVEPR